MSEKTKEFTEPELADNGEVELTLEVLKEHVFNLLRNSDSPLATEELTAAINNNGGGNQIEQRHVRLALEELQRAGRATYLNQDNLEHQPPLTERARRLLETTQMPMDISQLHTQLNQQAGDKVGSRRYLREMLASMHRQGKVKRLEEGVYAYIDFDRRGYKRRRRFENPKALILEILAGQPDEVFSVEDIASEMTARTGIPTDSRFTLVRASQLCQQKLVIKVGHNKYASLDFNEGEYESPPTLDELIIGRLEEAAGPLSRKQLIAVVESSFGQYPPASPTIGRHLKQLAQTGRILHIHHGVYAPASFDRRQYKQPKTKSEMIVEILRRNPEPLHVDEVIEQLGNLSGQTSSRKSVHNTLHSLKNAGRVANPSLGFFTESRPDNCRTATKYGLPEKALLSIIGNAGDGISLEDIVSAVRAMNIITKPDTIRKRLAVLKQQQLVEPTDSGWRLHSDASETIPAADADDEQPTYNIYKRIRQLLADINDWESAADLIDHLSEEGYAATPKAKTFITNRLDDKRR